MSVEILVPLLPESVSDATVAVWTKKVGEHVEEEEVLLELETDKVVLEVPSPVSGVLKEISHDQGATVVAGDLIGLIEQETATENVQITADESDSASQQAVAVSNTPAVDAVKEIPTPASPSVRKTMAENDLDFSRIQGTGKHGKITKEDVDKLVVEQPQQSTQAPAEITVLKQGSIPQTPKAESGDAPVKPAEQAEASKSFDHEMTEFNSDEQFERRVPMTRLRSRIAERLVEVQQTAAILSTFNEVDLTEIIRLRNIYKDRFEKVHGIKLGFMSFFVKAATEALKRYPEVNARIDGQDIVYQGKYHIGVAVSTERGLIVPVVRDTSTLGNAEIEKKIHDYAYRARNNQLELDELNGGTFSITNGGIFGSMLSTPIINPPQSAILGMHKIEDRPVAINGEVVVRPMMYLALSYDHRLIDGKTAVGFLVKIKELLEDPASLFLEL